ncbi:MAG: PorP/SprF family type IX secretion system membrane protein [Flavobacteriales bacterium]|jgi:type IX secretion system PorP/SprF family membrane protein|nr:PorP/SprF family type IX secretion system membrane protein [Flavobacteriales bacterium]MBK6550941.1 PorP/SprF family type IX secretion system membrane protein [Flavobacteriales bacterium]MBK6882498.1 PorP/SprF family type IX secretion system membrane protein [Flavobacteriales bacterium]MBK7101287.1 PorP/SprF family type IX secretion system membrane protein [Flavobacteriales bacterium]MBK7111994.1 PorP/SprF family type IX secretion system membrane protein [Flavobacteriales bacterium]
MGTACRVHAQDIHFSQFFNSPLASGPGAIGTFEGQYRFNGIFRQQWRSVTIPYRTFAFGADAADVGGIGGLGVGAWIYNDRAGDSQLNQFHFSMGASWTEHFGADRDHALTGGVQFGITNLSLDPSSLTFDSQYNGYYFDPNSATNERIIRDAKTHSDLHAGLVYRFNMDHRKGVQVGFNAFNLTTPNIDFLGGPYTALDVRTSSHLMLWFPIAKKLDLRPMLQYMAQGEFQEFDIGSNVRYILLDRFGLLRALSVGLHYRAADAGYVYAGLEYDDWTFGMSYDINTSSLVPASRNRGAIELTAIRILRKRPVVPVRFKACPTQL